MNSQLRQDAQGGSKITKTEMRKIYYPPPNDKQFLAFSFVEKQGGLGMIFHERFLLFDSMKKRLGYYSQAPDPLPHPQQPYGDPKESIFIKKIRNFEFKPTKTEMGKVAVKWADLNGQSGQKKTWTLKFKTNYLMNQWVITVNQAIEQDHHRPENRPNVIRQSTKKDTSRYVTPFILETGGIESRRNSVAQSEYKNSVNWLTQSINQKQKQMRLNHNQIHNIDNVKMQQTHYQDQNYEQQKERQQKKQSSFIQPNKQSVLNSNGSDKTIKKITGTKAPQYTTHPIVEQKEDQSKVSNKQSQIHNTDSVKRFTINKVPPIIVEEQNSSDSRVQKEKGSKMGSAVKQQAIQRNKQKQTEMARNFIRTFKHPDKIENPVHQKKTNPISKPIGLIDRIKTSQDKHDWTDPKKYYPYLYSQFVQTCEQVSVALIDNLTFLLKQAQLNPTPTLYATQTNLIVLKNRIQFDISLGSSHLQKSALILKQHSSIVSYINRLSSSSIGSKQMKITALPNCIIEYKWHAVKCKALINQQKYTKMTEPENRKAMDEFFSMPSQVWDYYYGADGIVVDHTRSTLDPSGIHPNIINQIAQNLCRQDPVIGSILDLQIYCSTNYSIAVDTQTFLKIFSKCYEISSIAPPSPIFISILYSIKVSEYMRANFFPRLYTLSATEFQQKINAAISLIMSQGNRSLSLNIQRQVSEELESIGIRNIQVDQYIDYWCVWASLGQLMGLDVLLNGNKFSLGKFKINSFQISIQALSEEMAKIEEILNQCESNGVSENRRYQGYLSMVQMLEKYEYLMQEVEYGQKNFNIYSISSTPKPTNISPLKKYSNLSLRIFHYKSLYQPYFRSNSQQTDPYCASLEQIMNSAPPTYYSYMISINCLKWISKKQLEDRESVHSLIVDHIDHCKKWAGESNLFLLSYYELCSVYNQQIFHIHRAIQYARLALSVVNQMYGEYSAEAAERWFLLGNVMFQDDDLYEQALQAYQKSLQILHKSQWNSVDLVQSFTSSRASLLPFQNGTGEAEVTIRLKIIKLYLALNGIPRCLEECSQCLYLCQQLPNPNAYSQLQIFSSLIKCLDLAKQHHKLLLILETTARKFGLRIPSIYPNCSEEALSYQEQLRESMIKVCLAPYIALRITDENRKTYLLKLVKSVRKMYEHRYNKKQYNTYLTKTLYSYSHEDVNIIEWFVGMCEQIPIFSSYMRTRGANRDREHDRAELEEINYSLEQNPVSIKINATQNKMLVPMMRAMEAMSGVIGYSYLISCFSD